MAVIESSADAWSISTFKRIYGSKDAVDPPVGILTGVDRDHWTDARAHLLETSPDNVKTLSAIEAASFVVSLDEAKPASDINGAADFSKELFYGNGESRWYDKPLQWVVFDSGEAGFIGEVSTDHCFCDHCSYLLAQHSCMDGTPTMRMNHYLGERLNKRDYATTGSDTAIEPEQLSFKLEEASKASIAQAKQDYANASADQDLGYLYYTRYGKNGIKAAKSSPDGWVQMVMQLAYALTFPDAPVTGTYEAAMTRKYSLGRTETVRVCSPASKAFVLASLPGSGVSDIEKRRLFLEALAQQGEDMKDASNAMGCDRHVFGLKMINAEQGDGQSVELFGDDLFKRSGTWQLSTSAIISKYFAAYGWGQVVPNGFGEADSVHFFVLG